jgi:hypothetical protein
VRDCNTCGTAGVIHCQGVSINASPEPPKAG